MTDLADRVRAATRARAQEITPDSIAPLRLEPRSSVPGFWPRWQPRIVPLVAAAAVLTILALTTILGARLVDRPQAPVYGPVAPAAALQGIPAYYLALTGTSQPYATNPDDAGVYSTATGAELARVVPPPPYQTFINVSAAADDRTFALAAQVTTGQDSSAPTVFYTLRFSPADRQTRLTRVPGLTVPAGASLDAFALSPDGRTLAVAFEPNGHAPKVSTEIRIEYLPTGDVTIWSSSDGTVEGDTADPWSLSWTRDSKTLAFNWAGAAIPPGRTTARMKAASGLRLLNVTTGRGGLDTASRLALPFRAPAWATAAGRLSDIALITPDGRSVVAAVLGPDHHPLQPSSWHDAGFAEFSAATGKLREVRDWKKAGGQQAGGPADVLWSSASGNLLIVYAPPGHWDRIGILRGNHVTLLPYSAAAQFPAAAW